MDAIKSTKAAVFAFALTTLAACGNPLQTTLEDGRVAYRMECEGTATSMNYCFERAGKSCGADGYTIVSRDGRLLSTSDVAETDMPSLYRAFETDKNSILVACNKPE